jgi:hypothetical protein
MYSPEHLFWSIQGWSPAFEQKLFEEKSRRRHIAANKMLQKRAN